MQQQAVIARRISTIHGGKTGLVYLPRGGVIVKTLIGNIQYGLPPETVKDSLKMGLEVPTYFIIPTKRFDRKTGINIAEVEFPAYFNFFCNKKQICLICTADAETDIRDIFQETLIGPTEHPNLSEDFYHQFPESGYPNFIEERKIFSSNPLNPSEDLKVENLLSFKVFDDIDKKVSITHEDNHIEIYLKHGFFEIYQNSEFIATIEDRVDLGDNNSQQSLSRISRFSTICCSHSMTSPHRSSGSSSHSPKKRYNMNNQQQSVQQQCPSLENLSPFLTASSTIANQRKTTTQISSLFLPPDFGVTILGSSHGFDPNGSTSGFIVWIYGRGIMVDPPPFSNDYMKSLGINYSLINGIIISHCHADHDAGAFHQILADQKIEVITTPTIMNSFLRKYSAVSQIPSEELQRLFVFRPVVIGTQLNIFGAQFRFFYAFHTIPSLGFEVTVSHKTIYFSADTFYHPEEIRKFCAEKKISQARCDQLANIDFDSYDLILHEAGVPPIHTPQSVLVSLPDRIKEKMWVIHMAGKDLSPNSGLRIPLVGIENTIVLHQHIKKSEVQLLKTLDVISKIDLFEDLSIKHSKHLIDAFNYEYFSNGETIFSEGDQGFKFYIIQQGIVRISSAKFSEVDKLFQVGDYFGEICLFEPNCKRVAKAEALVDCTLLTLEKHDVNFLFGGQNGGTGVVLQRLIQLSRARKSLAIVAIEMNSILCELEQSQKTQLEMIMKEYTIPQWQILWKQNEKTDNSFLIKEGELLMFKSHQTLTDEQILAISQKPFMNKDMMDSSSSSSNGSCSDSSEICSEEQDEIEEENMEVEEKDNKNSNIELDDHENNVIKHSLVLVGQGAFIGDTKSIQSAVQKSVSYLVARVQTTAFKIAHQDLLKFLDQNPGTKLLFEEREYFE